MPGIVGIISKLYNRENTNSLNLMLNCMFHESFYTFGTYINEQLGLYTGWISHEGSFAENMPVTNEGKDLLLFFAGENFADKELINQLRKDGHEFDSSNASYLIHLYEENRSEFFQILNGWFSGILVDLRRGDIILFNDRYGLHRVYYFEKQDAFYFSSEAKSLLKILPELREINPKSLGEFVGCGSVLQNRTLFQNILVLPGGSAWVFNNKYRVKKNYYFKKEVWENQPVLEKEIFYKRLEETFINILPRYFNSNQPVAMALTGGLDTRMILSCIEIPSGALPCYTFGGMYRDSFDIKVARKVANACHQMHHVLQIDNEFLVKFPYYAEKTIFVTDGCHDVCGSHDIYLNMLARRIAPIRITGKFGSEVLRDACTFKAISLPEKLFHADFNTFIQHARNTLSNMMAGNRLSFTLFKDVPWHEYGRLAAEQSQLTYRTPYLDNDIVGLIYQAPQGVRASQQILLKLIDDNSSLLNIITDMGYGGKSGLTFSKILQLFYWFLFKMEWYYNAGMPHWLAKLDYLFAPLHLERFFVGNHKIERYRLWFRFELSDYVRDILLDKRTLDRPYLNKVFVEKMVVDHIKGTGNYLNEINKILSVELINRLLIEDE